jgi:hypothetical protein
MSPALPPFEVSSTTCLLNESFKYTYPLQLGLSYLKLFKLSETSLSEIQEAFNSNSATTFFICDFQQSNSFESVWNQDFTDEFDVHIFLPVKKSFNVKANINKVSKFTPHFFLD